MKKFKDLYKNLEENMNDYPPGFSDGSDKRTVGGDSFGAFRVGEGNTISRINAFINKYLIGSYLPGDYKLALRELRVRLNHIGLDFDSEKELVQGENRIKVKLHGDAFGTTPTTDLSKGFDRGEDFPTLTLVLNYEHNKATNMCYITGNLTPESSVNEEQLNEFLPALAAALPTIIQGARAVGAVASAAGAVKNVVSSKSEQDSMGEYGPSPRQKRINNAKKILKKKDLNEFAPLVPILVGAARIAAPILIGKAIEKLTASKEKPVEPTPQEPDKKEEPIVPYSIAGKSNLGRWDNKNSTVRKSRGKLTTPRQVVSESKDEPRVVEHHIMRDKNIKEKVLKPIYLTLKKLKEKNKYSRDAAAKHLYYVVNYAIRDLNKGDKKVTLSQIEKARVVNDLVRNFEKMIK